MRVLQQLFGPVLPPPGRRILLLSYHFPPGQATGALRWQKLSAYAAERGWGMDVLCAHPDLLTTTDPSRLAELPPGTRVFGVRPRPRRLAGWSARTRDTLHALRGRLRDARAGTGSPGRAVASADIVYREALDRGAGPRALLRAWRAWRSFAGDGVWARAAVDAALRLAAAGRYSAVVSCGPPHGVHRAGRAVAVRTGLPLAADFRDAWSLIPAIPAGSASPLWYRLAERHERAVVRSASLVVANTAALAEAMRALHPRQAERVITVMNGCDEEPIPPPERDGRFVVAYSGSIYIDRDPRPFFRAAARFAAAEGLGPERFAIELMGHVDVFGGVPVAELAAEEGAGAHLHLLARRSRPEALRAMARASVLLSLPQGVDLAIPSKIFEYMQFPAWILALARRGSATERLLRGTTADVVDPADVHGIEAVLRDRFRRFSAGEVPRPVNADGRFGRRRQAEKLLDALERVVKARAEAPAGRRPARGRAA